MLNERRRYGNDGNADLFGQREQPEDRTGGGAVNGRLCGKDEHRQRVNCGDGERRYDVRRGGRIQPQHEQNVPHERVQVQHQF